MTFVANFLTPFLWSNLVSRVLFEKGLELYVPISFIVSLVFIDYLNFLFLFSACESSDSLMVYDIKASKPLEVNLTQNLNKGFGSNSTVTSCVFNHNAQMIITGNRSVFYLAFTEILDTKACKVYFWLKYGAQRLVFFYDLSDIMQKFTIFQEGLFDMKFIVYMLKWVTLS